MNLTPDEKLIWAGLHGSLMARAYDNNPPHDELMEATRLAARLANTHIERLRAMHGLPSLEGWDLKGEPIAHSPANPRRKL